MVGKKGSEGKYLSDKIGDLGNYYRIPESLRAFCRIVSLTAAKTRRIFVVSVACVRLKILLAGPLENNPTDEYSLGV